jgi:septal ring factor EnvC (AmiA/AmiB activator)
MLAYLLQRVMHLQKRLAKEAKEKQRLEKLAATKGEAAAAAAAADAARKAADGKKAGPARGTLFYKVTVKVCDGQAC